MSTQIIDLKRGASIYKPRKVVVGLGYGLLYNWYAASSSLLPPTGWHVPTVAEFNTLINYLGGNSSAGAALKETGNEHWTNNTSANNNSGFSAYGAGYRDGDFFNKLYMSRFWAADSVKYMQLDNGNSNAAVYSSYFSSYGQSIRLIRDSGNSDTQCVDYEGNIYNSINVGTQTWLVRNWKSKKFRDGSTIGTGGIYENLQWSNLTTPACCAYNNDETNI